MKIYRLLLTSALLFLIVNSANAGNEPKTFSDFYKNHKHKETVSMNIPGFFVRFLIGNEEEDVKELAKNIKHLRLLVFEGQASSRKSLTQELNQYLPSKIYNDLMVIKDGQDEVTFKLRENEGKIKEIIMIATDQDSSVILCIDGKMELEDARKLVKSIKIEDLKDKASEGE